MVIIGSGPGGYVAAIRAGQWGLKTAVVEKDPFLGGTCLHVGCIPTKVFLHHADIYDYFQRAEEFGFEVERRESQLARHARAQGQDRQEARGRNRQPLPEKQGRVDHRLGTHRRSGPRFRGKGRRRGRVGNHLYDGRHRLRGACLLPGVEIDGKVIGLTSREILQLSAIPKALVVVGAGAVGVEFASIFRTFGTEVTILEALPRIVPLEDEDISREVEKAFKKKGIRIETGATVDSVKKTAGGGGTVSFKDKSGKAQSIAAERVLIAVGRRPLTENIGLEKTKAKVERGFIHTNAYMETDEPRLYAIGDIVVGLPQLAHAALMEGIIAVAAWREKMCSHSTASAARLHVLRTSDRIHGLTEKQAREAGYEIKTGKFPFLGNSKATILGMHEGFIKVWRKRNTARSLGSTRSGRSRRRYRRAGGRAGTRSHARRHGRHDHAHPRCGAMGDAFHSVRGLAIKPLLAVFQSG